MSDGQTTYQEVGHAVRRLHEALKELGVEASLRQTAGELPDTKDRLAYVATLSEQAANRALAAVEAAKPIQAELQSRAVELLRRCREGEDGPVWRGEMEAFLAGIPATVQATDAQLNEIMMAQDFQDLTGQVIKKVTRVAQELEEQLVNVLLVAQGAAKPEGELEGPITNKEKREDVVKDQQDVDDLLDSLGF